MERVSEYLQRKSVRFSDRLEVAVKSDSFRINPWLCISWICHTFIFTILYGNLVENIVIYKVKKEKGAILRKMVNSCLYKLNEVQCSI